MLAATLLLLAGGESRRMGRPKGLLPVAGTTLLEWLAARLSDGIEELLVSARDPSQVPPALLARTVFDGGLGAGPLAGIAAGLLAARHELVLVVACDMPGVSPGLLEALHRQVRGFDAAVPRIGGRPEPACACYRRSAERPIRDALQAGRLRASDVLEGISVRWVEDLDPNHLRSLNTQEDYQEFISTL